MLAIIHAQVTKQLAVAISDRNLKYFRELGRYLKETPRRTSADVKSTDLKRNLEKFFGVILDRFPKHKYYRNHEKGSTKHILRLVRRICSDRLLFIHFLPALVH